MNSRLRLHMKMSSAAVISQSQTRASSSVITAAFSPIMIVGALVLVSRGDPDRHRCGFGVFAIMPFRHPIAPEGA